MDDEILIESSEFKNRYIKYLIENGLNEKMANEDYKSMIAHNEDDAAANPEYIASDSLSYYGD